VLHSVIDFIHMLIDLVGNKINRLYKETYRIHRLNTLCP